MHVRRAVGEQTRYAVRPPVHVPVHVLITRTVGLPRVGHLPHGPVGVVVSQAGIEDCALTELPAAVSAPVKNTIDRGCSFADTGLPGFFLFAR